MAKQLSMEELIKKYQYLRVNQQSTSTNNIETNNNSKTNEKDNSDFSSIRSIPTDTPIESATSSEDACKVCLDATANCAFIECGHIVSCLNCAKLLTKCPICRETIKRTLRVYKS